ncbi:hypothetical protein SAMN06296386_10512 [Lachnospiraceae bacterium]|nr:hypothetical protein SAMN06296386_10512 [Lachnospiraceae bacterium]
MEERELIGLYLDKTAESLKSAAEDDFSVLVNAVNGLVLYPKADDLSVLDDEMTFTEGSKAAEVFAAHSAEDAEKPIVDTYFARGYVNGFFRIMNSEEKVTPKNVLLRMRHAAIHTHIAVDPENKTIAFNDVTRFTDVGFWNKEHVFAKDRRNPHNNHKIEKLENFKAEFTFEEFRNLLIGYCEVLKERYPRKSFGA